MKTNYLFVFLASLVPTIVGFIWYHPKVFGNVWMRESGMTMEKAKSGNMIKTMGLMYVLSLMIAFFMSQLVIHQNALYSLVFTDTTADTQAWLQDSMARFGTKFRTFKHGMLHGFISGLFLALPMIGTGALYEQRSGKYIWITAGFWIISMMIMGGIICQWA